MSAPERFARRTGSKLDEVLQDSDQDKDAQLQLAEVLEQIGRAIANAHLLLDLEAVILTGGITALGERLRGAHRNRLFGCLPKEYRRGLEIKSAVLGNTLEP